MFEYECITDSIHYKTLRSIKLEHRTIDGTTINFHDSIDSNISNLNYNWREYHTFNVHVYYWLTINADAKKFKRMTWLIESINFMSNKCTNTMKSEQLLFYIESVKSNSIKNV